MSFIIYFVSNSDPPREVPQRPGEGAQEGAAQAVPRGAVEEVRPGAGEGAQAGAKCRHFP